ncbi:ArsR family transcriptional regulator [Natronolimnobius sp. AArcel1]|uniref:DUF7344 domain-containing protein n=1 Tax=Natronolimnobius sp. AArcel1 TaxID=1679093 RepID=UPI0013EBD6D4|nr:ArsR family transcriptional regulator [Natronolimnobius sp. AArcel1]NGM68992.1 ArsR family transcriptional regulator [Natronolimnobius sp. AArcel1]
MLPVVSDPESLTPVSTTSDDARGESTDESTSNTHGVDAANDPRRRAILEYLSTRAETEPVPIADLADHLLSTDHAGDRGALAACGDALVGTNRRIRISLRHHHVPKLVEAGLLEFDLEQNTVTLDETESDRGV